MSASQRRPPDARHDQLMLFARRIGKVALVSVGLVLLGALGLSLSENASYWFSFRWALDTAATEGNFSSPHTLAGQIVQIALIIVGVGTLFYALATIAEFFAAGHLADLLAGRRTQNMIDSLTDHHIVCGFGRVGRQVAMDLQAANAPAVVIDMDFENRHGAEGLGIHFIEGDASDEAVLLQAGIARARSIVACSD